MAEHEVGNNSDIEGLGASLVENYGATAQDNEPSSTRTQNENTALLQINAEDETAITATTGVSSLLSNTSADSHYFKQNNEFRPGPRKPGHTHSDSLDYSITSSTNSLYIPTPTNQGEDRANGSYMGSIERSLRNQHQAFPSSMFPGQKLISPTNEKNVTEMPRDTPGYPSYYYFPSSPHKNRSLGSGSKHPYLNYNPLPPSYQKVSRNVYQKRLNPGFCPLEGDALEFCGKDDKTLVSSWTSCWRCFFSPRVLLTLVICGVIVFNLLRDFEQHHYYYQRASLTNQNSSVRGGTSEYVKLNVIGATTSDSNP